MPLENITKSLFLILGEVYYHSKEYPGILILSSPYGDTVVSVWNYHGFPFHGHLRFWSRPRKYKAHSQISKHF